MPAASDDAGRSGRRPVAEHEFRELVDSHRSDLHAHCYRMLGSLHEADDALQDILVRVWRGLPSFHGRSTLRTWLYRIATNVCLDEIARRSKRVLPVDYGPPTDASLPEADRPTADAVWIEPYPDQEFGVEEGMETPAARFERREALELAFVAALQHLRPQQRAALILRDVLGFSAKEAAVALDTTVPSVNSALRRARLATGERVPAQSQQRSLRALGDRRLREVVNRFVDSFERGDVETILSMLTDDATFSMPPYPDWSHGREAIAESWLIPRGTRLRYAPARANAQIALGAYAYDRGTGAFRPIALDVLAFRGELIESITAFRLPEMLTRFNLPDSIPGAPS